MIKEIKTKIIVWVILIGMAFVGKAFGQEYTPSWKLSVGGGYMNYFGDVSPYTIKHWSDWDNVFKFFQYNKYYIPSASYGVTIERYLSPGVSLMLQLNKGTISMSDRYIQPDGDYDQTSPHWNRALNFKTRLEDAGLALVFRSNNGRIFPIRSFFAPYFLLGAGMTHFSVKGDLYDKAGNTYDYTDPEVAPDGIYETPLRPLMTETSRKYADVVPYVDAGIGLSLNISKSLSLALQTDIKYAFSDYLDDVSGAYKTIYTSDASAYAAHPGTNFTGSGNRNRGNNDGVNDFYIFNKITLNINLGKRPFYHFTAPAIYLPESFIVNDSIAVKDTLNTFGDTIVMQKKEFPDTLARYLNHTLAQIRFELASLRFAYLDQNYIIQQNEVQQQIDTLEAQKYALQAGNGNAKDSLQARLNGFQLDSLKLKLEAIHMARMQLRHQMANTPIVTEYRDSTKIMIYKNPAASFSPDSINAGMDSIAETNFYPDSFGYINRADSLRNELSRLQKEAVSRKDTARFQQLWSMQSELDSMEHNEKRTRMDSLAREYYIQEDSLKIMELRRRGDSLRSLQNTFPEQEPVQNRNAVQRFFDKFKRNKQDGNKSDLPLNTDSANYDFHPDTNNTYKSPDENYNRERKLIPDPETRRLLQQNQDEIDRLHDEIKSLRRYSSSYKRPSTVIYRNNDDYSPRQARRDRRQMRELNSAVLAAGALAGAQKKSPSPNVIITPNYSNSDSAALQDIRQQLAALQRQSELSDNEKWARDILKDTVTTQHENSTVGLLQSKVDSLSKELALLNRGPATDTVTVTSPPEEVILKNYPTVSVYFAVGSASLNNKEKAKLKPLVMIAHQYPEAKLLVTGYTDGTGNKKINEILSEKRCDEVKRILVGQYHIQPQRLVMKANTSEGGVSNPLKRRVDLKFIE